jgi:hypothetical protein
VLKAILRGSDRQTHRHNEIGSNRQTDTISETMAVHTGTLVDTQ